MAKTYKPGEKVPASGQYKTIDTKGRDKGHEVTSVKGEPFPPTQKPGERYVMADKTRHKKK